MNKNNYEAPLEYVESTIFDESLKEIINSVSWKVDAFVKEGSIIIKLTATMNYAIENIWGKINCPQNILVQQFEVTSYSVSKIKTGDTKISFTGEFGYIEKIYGVNTFADQLIFERVKSKIDKTQNSNCDLGYRQVKLSVDTDKETYKISFILCKK